MKLRGGGFGGCMSRLGAGDSVRRVVGSNADANWRASGLIDFNHSRHQPLHVPCMPIFAVDTTSNEGSHELRADSLTRHCLGFQSKSTHQSLSHAGIHRSACALEARLQLPYVPVPHFNNPSKSIELYVPFICLFLAQFHFCSSLVSCAVKGRAAPCPDM